MGVGMPKQKVHKGLRKRVKVTAKGKVAHKSAFGRKLMSGKSGKRRRRLRKTGLLQSSESRRVKRALAI